MASAAAVAVEEPREEDILDGLADLADAFHDEAGGITDDAAEADLGDPDDATPDAETDAETPDAEDEAAGDDGEAEPPEQAAAAEPAQEETPALSRGWDSLKRRESELQQSEQRIKETRQQLDAAMEQAKQASALIEDLRRDPLGTLARHGMSFDDLANRALSGGAPKAVTENDKVIAELRQEVSELKQYRQSQAEAQQQAQHQRILADYRAGIAAAVKSDPVLSVFGPSVDGIYERALDAAASGSPMSAEDAVERFRSDIYDQLKSLGSHKAALAALGIGAGEVEDKEEDPGAAEASEKGELKPKGKTLTNQLKKGAAKVRQQSESSMFQDEEDFLADFVAGIPD